MKHVDGRLEQAQGAKIYVWGVVQGVGFRPFVYRIANEHRLRGWVCNTSENVEIEVEGGKEDLENFISDLETKAPPMSRIERVEFSLQPPRGHSGFEIHESMSLEGKYQLVSPDIATCEDCKREIFNPDDRRYRYPFTNCTNCGPRFTIIEDIPYDRPRTTMRRFVMCPQCQREYDDPMNRRFHAQPNACPECGPRLQLIDADGSDVGDGDVIKAVCALLKEGRILAIKGLGGFQLACDATSEEAVKLLRTRKRRPSKPFAIMVAGVEEALKHCDISREEKEILESPGAPIVLLKWKRDTSGIATAVAPNLKYMGVMLPYTPLHHILLNEVGLPLVMTSGNLVEEPIASDNDEAMIRLRGIADYFLVHDRDIYTRYDDSVYMVEGMPQVVRRARGYAPYPVFLQFKAKQILACGAEEKNTFCLTRDEHAFLSQHIGSMENEETLEHFENTVEIFKKLFRVQPEIVAYDMHPEYLSTKYALQLCSEQGLEGVPVQHHHAHIVSCMVDNRIEGPVIGVSFDGTGYGVDGTIWGGEFLLADRAKFRRVGHLEYVPMPGGAAAIKKPYRMALSYLYTLLDGDMPLDGLPLSELDSGDVAIVRQQITRGLNSPLTSSAGRLFDGVSALAGVRWEIDYESQAAVELEMLATDGTAELEGESYPFSIVKEGEVNIVKLRELFSAVVQDVRGSVPAAEISLRFHRTMARIIARMCGVIAGESGVNEIALSGGVFQNRLLLKLALNALQGEGMKVFIHQTMPCNDGCISLGQAVIANFAKG